MWKLDTTVRGRSMPDAGVVFSRSLRRRLAAVDMTPEERREVTTGSLVDRAEEARGGERSALVREGADGIVQAAVSVGDPTDLVIEPVHHERGAVVEGRRYPGAREVAPPAAVALEEGEAADEGLWRETSRPIRKGERVVFGEPLAHPAPVGRRVERLPDVEELVQVAARLVGRPDRNATMHEEGVLAREPAVPHRIGCAHDQQARRRRTEDPDEERNRLAVEPEEPPHIERRTRRDRDRHLQPGDRVAIAGDATEEQPPPRPVARTSVVRSSRKTRRKAAISSMPASSQWTCARRGSRRESRTT